jgi:hypothetical protein
MVCLDCVDENISEAECGDNDHEVGNNHESDRESRKPNSEETDGKEVPVHI